MASDLNKVIIIGRLVSDPDIQQTPSGTKVVKFKLANNRTFVSNGEKRNEVNYITIVAWTKLGELVAQYCQKGRQVAVEGRLRQRRWVDKATDQTRTTFEIVADNVQFLGMPKGVEEVEPIEEDVPPEDELDEEVPF